MRKNIDRTNFIRFLKDERFIEWKISPTTELGEFWEEFLLLHPNEREAFELAEKHFRNIHLSSYEITKQKRERAIQQMEKSLHAYRLKRKKEFLPGNGLIIEWHETDETMLDVELSYTNLANEVKTIVVSKESTSSLLSDFNVEHPFSYTTLYKPDSLAIDIFHAAPQEEHVSYYANISHILQHTGDPFQLGEMVHDNRFYKLPGWQTNAAGGRNGNLDVLKNSPNHGLTLWAWSGYSPLSSFENGKLYQTVELEEGTYRFDALIYATSPSLNRAYVVAALGNELPDIDKLSTALSTTVVPNDIKDSSLNKPILSIEFTLREKTNVTLGFVADIGHAQETIFKKVELFEKR